MLTLYNTLSQKKEPLVIKNNTVTMYVCGITPYDTTHLGHAFTYANFDVLLRFLRHQGYKVIYTQNVTDIDDPLFERARAMGTDWKTLGDTYTKQFLADLQTLNIIFPDHYTKVTEEIPKIISLVKTLVEKAAAYERNGTVYFDVQKDKDYGKLSKLTFQEMLPISSERGNDPKDPQKKHPLDFILWQPSQVDEPAWESPWGKGRPGWHIECSAMSMRYLGEQITLHGGGYDLIFPHHESEIAQSETVTGKKPFSYHFMHTALVSYQGEKMSKSLGNLILVKDLAKRYDAVVIRWYLLSHHYRQAWEYYEEEMKAAQELINRLKEKLTLSAKKVVTEKDLAVFKKTFIGALENDLDTPQALNILRQGVQTLGQAGKAVFKECGEILGLTL